jgi:hypothetical protein
VILSDKGSALLIRNRDSRLVENVAAVIVRVSLRECEALDELWLRCNSHNCAPERKGAHREFLCELLSFHCCMAEQLIRRECTGPLERFLQLTSLAVAKAAVSDAVLDRPPFFVADRPEMRLERYRSRIESTRSEFTQDAADEKSYTLLHDTAVRVAKTALGFDRTPESVSTLALQIVSRLQWTSREVIG